MKTGVYQIRNLINGKRYIGSAAITFKDRWKYHKRDLRKDKHCSTHLQHAWNKYSEDSFVFEILLYCDPENCLFYEQLALDYYKPEYNICQIAGNTLGRKHSAESKAKISSKTIGKNNPMYGKKHLASSRTKIKENHANVSGENNPNYGKDFRGENHPRWNSHLPRYEIYQCQFTKISVKKIASVYKTSPSTIRRIYKDNKWRET